MPKPLNLLKLSSCKEILYINVILILRMEVWKDYQTGKYYKIDENTGKQSPSNRFGGEKTYFTAYSTGFPHILPAKPVPVDRMYSVQPHKFDGYCQFPRPSEKFPTNPSPYVRKLVKPSKVYIKEESKIPVPLNFLNFSQSQNRSVSPRRSAHQICHSLPASELNTLEDIKSSLVKKPLKDLRTVTDLSIKLESEKQNSKGYVRPRSKVLRRKLKGFFLKDFKTSGELFNTERRIWQATNPTLFQKLKKYEEFDRRMLEKKSKAARLLQNN